MTNRWAGGLGALAVLGAAEVACGGAAAIDVRSVSPSKRAPVVAERIALPSGASAASVWMSPEGDGMIALRDGRILAIDVRGGVHPVDPFPGEPPLGGEGAVVQLSARAPESAVGVTANGAVVIERGMVRRAKLPSFLDGPRAFAPLGAEALWATSNGLYASYRDKWLTVDGPSGPMRDVTELLSFGREAWVHAGAQLFRLRIDPYGNPAHATFVDPAPGVDLGAVKAVARMDARRGAIVSSRGVTIAGPDRIRTFVSLPEDGLPQTIGAGGGWAWVGWAGEILRTDGESWEALASGVKLSEGSHIAVDDGSGSTALIVDDTGSVIRIEAEETVRTSGLGEGASVLDTRIELEATPPAGTSKVTFLLDGHEAAIRASAPWGWGDGGGRVLDARGMKFGSHRVEVVATASRNGKSTETRRAIDFDYVSPLGRVPTYGDDVAPIFAARCARCHANGVAHDLASYGALSGQASSVRASVREGRMPPDVLLDSASTRLITAWVDGGAPK